jgi:hypothetical protein
MKIHEVTQGTPEWLKLRLGIPTASEFDQLVTPDGKVRTGAMPETLMVRKVCEKVLGFNPSETGTTFAMSQGVILEHEARPWFEFSTDTRVQQVGFCTTDDGLVGCSPDGLIGEDGGIEIKCPQPDRHLRYLLSGELPAEYVAQVQGSMWVTGRPWWKFVSYSRQFPPLVVHVKRDDQMQAAIRDALARFYGKFDVALAQITKLRAEQEQAHSQQ